MCLLFYQNNDKIHHGKLLVLIRCIQNICGIIALKAEPFQAIQLSVVL